MKKSARLVFFGTDSFSVPILEALVNANWSVVAVVTRPDSKAGRNQATSIPPVKTLAQKHRLEILQPTNLSEIIYKIAGLEPSHGILASYGKLVPQSLIDLFPGGIINVHPSLLPRWRGATPIETAILSGDEETGVSLMKLSIGMDEGPVYAQKRVVLTGEETTPQLRDQLAEIGANLLNEKLPDIVAGKLSPSPQNDIKATYTKLLAKADGAIDWSQPADIYERQIRAYLLYPKSSAEISGQRTVITKARVAKNAEDGSLVMTCNPGYLEVLELIAPSGRRISGIDFSRGYKNR